MLKIIKPPRTLWGNLPDVLIHASESAVKQHPDYKAAKSGYGFSATALINDTMSEPQNQRLADMLKGRQPILVSAHAYEREGINAILEAFAAVSLTGKPHSAKLALSPERLHELRLKHGKELENWWIERFAHAFDALTESEARYLARTETANTVRDRIAAAQ